MPVLSLSEIIGFFGVSILLAAFFLNLADFLLSTSKRYLVLNFVGAALAGYSSWLIGFMPFVLLEGTWAAVALLTLAGGTFVHNREHQRWGNFLHSPTTANSQDEIARY